MARVKCVGRTRAGAPGTMPKCAFPPPPGDDDDDDGGNDGCADQKRTRRCLKKRDKGKCARKQRRMSKVCAVTCGLCGMGRWRNQIG